MRLENFHAFLEVAETRSITKASENLFTTPQNVSKLMHAVEDDLECELFVRQKKNMVLTDEGRIAYEIIKKIVTDYDGLKDQISFIKFKNLVILDKLGILVTHAAFESMHDFFNEDIVRLQNSMIEVMETNVEEIIVAADCPNTKVDYIFLSMQLRSFLQHYQILEKNYDCYILDSERMYVYMNKNSEYARKQYISAKDLAEMPLLGFPLSYAMVGSTYDVFTTDNNLKLNTVLLSTNKNNWLAWLKSNRACILTSHSIIHDIAREMGNSLVKVATKPVFNMELIMCRKKTPTHGEDTLKEIDKMIVERYPISKPIIFDIQQES